MLEFPKGMDNRLANANNWIVKLKCTAIAYWFLKMYTYTTNINNEA